MEYRNKNTGIVYKTDNPELIDLFNSSGSMEKVEEAAAAVKAAQPRKTTPRKKK